MRYRSIKLSNSSNLIMPNYPIPFLNISTQPLISTKPILALDNTKVSFPRTLPQELPLEWVYGQ
jgi:hypothetical protein